MGAGEEVAGTAAAVATGIPAPVVLVESTGTDTAGALRWGILLDAATDQTYYYNKRTIYDILT